MVESIIHNMFYSLHIHVPTTAIKTWHNAFFFHRNYLTSRSWNWVRTGCLSWKLMPFHHYQSYKPYAWRGTNSVWIVCQRLHEHFLYRNWTLVTTYLQVAWDQITYIHYQDWEFCNFLTINLPVFIKVHWLVSRLLSLSHCITTKLMFLKTMHLVNCGRWLNLTWLIIVL